MIEQELKLTLAGEVTYPESPPSEQASASEETEAPRSADDDEQEQNA